MFCAIWYHLYNFKNVKNTHAGVFPGIFLLPVNGVRKLKFELNFENSVYNENIFFLYYNLFDPEKTDTEVKSTP